MAGTRERSTTEELRQYFASRLPVRVSEVEAAADAARDAGLAEGPLRTFHRLAHSLAGTGATFGFDEVSAAARELEDLLASALDAGAPPESAAVAGLLSRLRGLAESASL